MIIGIPKEIKEGEYRVSITPSNVQKLTLRNHTVLVETGAGAASRFTDEEYEAAGARILKEPDEVWKQAEMIVKVKEIPPEEFDLLEEKHIIMTYIHSQSPAPNQSSSRP